ncbi:MAG TPA: TadG family pilus assembly protein, partial [Myxococcota bacterium]|nr:TadG family pilus assembly protein [Myxococcota bacterium]
MVLLLGVLFGFGALAVDVSMIRLAQTEAQDIADAASHAAIAELKDSHDLSLARQAAEEVVAANTLAGDEAVLLDIDAGTWDPSSRSFVGGSVSNAIQVRVGRTGNQAVRLALGTLLGWYSVDVAATATAATQSVQVILVMDITGSWEQRNFVKAREAAMTFLDSLHQNHGPQDMVGMVVFMNRYGWEYTPMTSVEDSFANANLVTNKWAKLNVGSYAGEYQTAWTTGSNLTNIHVACKVYGNANNGTRWNPFVRGPNP